MVMSLMARIGYQEISRTVLSKITSYSFKQVRNHNKHWNPRYKRLRQLKVVPVELPNFQEWQDEDDINFDEEKMRLKMKKEGIQPARPWTERPMYLASSANIFEPYIPPEGDGKASMLTTAGPKEKLQWLQKKGTSWKEFRKIRKYDEDFELYPDFVDAATETYIKAHVAMAERNKDELIQHVTEKAFVEMIHNIDRKTINWTFVKSLEPPQVAHVRTTDMLSKDNIYGQITVRFHTQQILAIYDRFGRLMFGSEILAKDVLEYVVFEKHLTYQYGKWRLHAKIIPDWAPPREPIPKTRVTSNMELPKVVKNVKTSNTPKAVTNIPIKKPVDRKRHIRKFAL